MTGLNRRAFVTVAASAIAAPYVSRKAHADDTIKMRCSLDTAPSHPRNQAILDYVAKLEEASKGKIKSEVFQSGQLFADLNVTKALLQGQVDMASPGTWTMTGLVPDCDFCQLPALYSPSIDVFRRCADGAPGELVNKQLEAKMRSHILGSWLELGNENWYTTKKEVRSLDDLNGLKIRGPGRRPAFPGASPSCTAFPTSRHGRTCRWRCRKAPSTASSVQRRERATRPNSGKPASNIPTPTTVLRQLHPDGQRRLLVQAFRSRSQADARRLGGQYRALPGDVREIASQCPQGDAGQWRDLRRSVGRPGGGRSQAHDRGASRSHHATPNCRPTSSSW